MTQATTTKTETSLQLRRVFAASRERLFQAWTDPEMMSVWLHPDDQLKTVADVDLRVGGAYRIEMHPPEGEPYVAVGAYETIEAPEKLAFTWRWLHDEAESLVTVEFKALGPEKTELILTHERLQNAEDVDNHAAGWEGCYVQLERALEQQAV